ncbi:uncharacterized protein LOC133806206 [Humulus lupulus]|uniref:uncharacterized protein LOC133806206 n=1 Tax=Humulus lupulus TaxID=3486 RepID=UPI002B400659|nr:uncharacterized protein LOC133806206 [Humulus lupulus]
MGLTMVKFNDDATRDHVLENGFIHFDRKPVIVRPRTADLSAVRLVRSVPLWILLQDLGLQYWGSKCLSALVRTIGKPIMVDKFTRERSRIQFARVLVEMEITDNPPKSIQFINEHGQIMEQGVEYEWLQIKCKTCAGFGHSMAECRKDKKVQWARKEIEHPSEEEQGPGEHQAGKIEESEIQASSEVNKDRADPIEPVLPKEEAVAKVKSNQPWRTPKRMAAQVKEGQRSVTLANNAGHKNKNSNKFMVLQESMVNGKEGSSIPNTSNG